MGRSADQARMGMCCCSGEDASGDVLLIRRGWGCAVDQARMGVSSELFNDFSEQKYRQTLNRHIC